MSRPSETEKAGRRDNRRLHLGLRAVLGKRLTRRLLYEFPTLSGEVLLLSMGLFAFLTHHLSLTAQSVCTGPISFGSFACQPHRFGWLPMSTSSDQQVCAMYGCFFRLTSVCVGQRGVPTAVQPDMGAQAVRGREPCQPGVCVCVCRKPCIPSRFKMASPPVDPNLPINMQQGVWGPGGDLGGGMQPSSQAVHYTSISPNAPSPMCRVICAAVLSQYVPAPRGPQLLRFLLRGP